MSTPDVDEPSGRRPPRRPPLALDVIIDAALAIVDAEGLDALSMRRLGRTLGVEAMSLYHHVKDKDALLDLLIDRVYEGLEIGDPPDDWPGRLTAYCGALRAALTRHPNMMPAVATRPVMSTSTMGLVELSLEEFTSIGLDPQTARRVLAVSVSFIMGHVLSEVGARPELGGHSPEDVERFRAALGRDEFPLVVTALGERSPDRDAEFALGVSFLIEGIRATLGERPG